MNWTLNSQNWTAGFLRKENGHTVLEGTVAVALLLTVLVPVVGVISHTATQHAQRDRITATVMAQDALERTLQQDAFHPATWTSADARWTLTRTVDAPASVATVTIQVWRARSAPEDVRDRRPPLVELSTARFLPPDRR